MKAEDFNDRLEEIFAQRLTNPSVDDEFWNLPNERVWIGIEPHLPKRKKRGFFWLWWLCCGGLLLAGVWFLLPVGNTLWERRYLLEKMETLPSLQQAMVPSDTLLCTQEEASSLSQNVSLENTSTSFKFDAEATNLHDFSIVNTTNTHPSAEESLPVVSNEARNREETILPVVAKDTTNSLSYPLLCTSLRELVWDTAKYPIALVGKGVTKDFSPNWTLEMSFGDFLRLNPTHIQGNLDLKLINNHTNFAGVQAERQLSKKWSVGVGLSYSSLRFDADYLFHVDYSTIGERQTSLGVVQEYAYKLPSLASTLETRIVLVRDAQQNLQEGSDIPIEMELHHEVAYITVPTYVKYQFAIAKRYTPYTKVGLLSNILIGDLETAHTSTSSLHQDVRHHASSVTNNAQTNSVAPNRLALDGILAFGLKYHSNHNSYLFIEPTLKQELRPTYNNSAITNSTALGLIVGMGMQW